jgi:hypothetical protein
MPQATRPSGCTTPREAARRAGRAGSGCGSPRFRRRHREREKPLRVEGARVDADEGLDLCSQPRFECLQISAGRGRVRRPRHHLHGRWHSSLVDGLNQFVDTARGDVGHGDTQHPGPGQHRSESRPAGRDALPRHDIPPHGHVGTLAAPRAAPPTEITAQRTRASPRHTKPRPSGRDERRRPRIAGTSWIRRRPRAETAAARIRSRSSRLSPKVPGPTGPRPPASSTRASQTVSRSRSEADAQPVMRRVSVPAQLVLDP